MGEPTPGRPSWSKAGESPLKQDYNAGNPIPFVPFFQKRNPEYAWFTWGDGNSLLLLFFDILGTLINLVGAAAFAIPTIAKLEDPVFGMGPEYPAAFRAMVYGRICPGIAFAILWGNAYYAWMAHRVAGYLKRSDITALPYGLTTSGGIAVIFGVMLPAAFAVKFGNISDADGKITITPEEFATQVWYRGVAANFLCGVLEACGAIGIKYPGQALEFIRTKCVSKAALFSPICGIGFCWLALARFVDGNYHATIFYIPLALVFTSFYAEDGSGIYGKAPMSLIMVAYGTALYWFGADRTTASVPAGLLDNVGQFGNFFGVGLTGLQYAGSVIPIILPVAFANAVETMQNVQLAADVGDPYPLGEAMIVDGFGTMLGAVCGSVFPTTVYMGHMRHKANGATAGYSIINGLVYFVLIMCGLTSIINAVIDPVTAGLILMAVGLMVVQHCVEVSVPRHYPAICMGIMVVLCDFMAVKTLNWRGYTDKNDIKFKTAIANVGAGGGILLSMLFTQVVCDLIDNYFSRATAYSFILMIFSLFGLVHGNNKWAMGGGTLEYGQAAIITIQPGAVHLGTYHENEGWRFIVAYASLTVFCALHWLVQTYGFPGLGKVLKPAVIDLGHDLRPRPEWRPTTDTASLVEMAKEAPTAEQPIAVHEPNNQVVGKI